ncbi:fructosamine kinase family protein [Caenispirillum bisanense]|uniref:fructosamine kinase family protein n=1 Tax=Caenispirillum bisanense TaxID=414052 RepID=UPI0031D64262
MSRHPVEDRIAAVTGQPVKALRALAGGCVGDVLRADLSDGSAVVVKLADDDGGGLDIEGWMLRYLAEQSSLPVPRVLLAEPGFLLMTWVACSGSGAVTSVCQQQAAELIAALHGITAPTFGLERDTLIGGLPQPNPPSDRWLPFFRDHRLLAMAAEAHRAGRLPAACRSRVETLAGRLDRWLLEPERPSLIHGDLWTGNVLCGEHGIAAFVDPAIYYADPEIELAFTTLFGTFGDAFFRRYAELRPLAPGFMEERRDLYNLYPLLVHVRLFGGSYVGSVERILDRYLG